MSERPRLLLVDDHRLMLDSLKLGLEQEFEVAGMVPTGAEAMSACRKLKPDLVLLDLSLPDRSGLEVISDLRHEMPDTRILVVTMHLDRVLADAALQAGALGFIPKDADLDELRGAIRDVLAGRRFLSPHLPERCTRHFPGELQLNLSRLTARQRDIVRRLGDGKSTARIAVELHLSAPTVTFHRTRIRKTIGLKTEWDLIRFALMVREAEAERRLSPDRSS